MRHPNFRPARNHSRGLSLIEIMVGVAIALVTTLVIFQVFANSNTTSRATAAGNEAQISGNIGMFRLERDLKVAGMGFGRALTPMSLTGDAAPNPPCLVHAYNSSRVPAQFTFNLVHVQIIPGPSASDPDQIDVLYGNSDALTFGRRHTASTTLSTTAQDAVGISPKDLVIVTDFLPGPTAQPPAGCKLLEITSVVGNTLGHDSASIRNDPMGISVPAAGTLGGTLYNLGPIDPIPNPQRQGPSLNQWRIVNNTLQFSNLLGDSAVSTVAEGVVHLRAQYGVDDGAAGAGGAIAGDGIISPSEWKSTAPDNWSQVLAVRFALLARSGLLEKSAVTTGTPTWAGGTFDMGAMASDWRNYRYRVYESTVAMRNMIWGP